MDIPEADRPTPEQKALLSVLGRVIDEGRKQIRGGKVDEELLKQLGMSAPQFTAFVERYEEMFGKVASMPRSTARPSGTVRGAFLLTGAETLQKGRGVDSRLRGIKGAEKLTTDEIRKLYESRAAKVSPEYRKEVEAYFRAISEEAPTQRPATRPAE